MIRQRPSFGTWKLYVYIDFVWSLQRRRVQDTFPYAQFPRGQGPQSPIPCGKFVGIDVWKKIRIGMDI